ncbi:ArsR/SmtB family transcription factor [Abyssisolibacter fermentans]|uniref:ArsR/SmtB family transcription factor n=1 Tax=Abyssisolibacter fermentans TaxID=1766203 RepID=UPI000830DB24|nr:metalloregulator ArsR/SmtB family transcription factor [Abyssisolibacter fermentans]
MKDMVAKFKALGDETRFKIFILISKKKICSKCIAKRLNISESAVSQHLKILKNANLIHGEKISYFTLYTIQETELKQMSEFLLGNLQISDEMRAILDISGNCKHICSGKNKYYCGDK